MLTASPSPRPIPGAQSAFTPTFSPRAHASYESVHKSSISLSPIVKPRSAHVDTALQPTRTTSQWLHDVPPDPRPLHIITNQSTGRRNMVDAGTQYSPPSGYHSPSTYPKRHPAAQTESTQAATLNQDIASREVAMPSAPFSEEQIIGNQKVEQAVVGKRNSSVTSEQQSTASSHLSVQDNAIHDQGPSKRVRGEEPPVKIMPTKYETCDTRELVILIASMLMELIRYNDAIPLKDGHLTRFHSRAPPGISVLDYLQRITTHATLPPPILLSMVYYIDKLCALYPAFTISSLTVHRFLITSATVASKGLSDSFWTNKTYARVGGVSIKELALLEMEFLIRMQWRIVPKPEILIDYYRSLVERSPGYELEVQT